MTRPETSLTDLVGQEFGPYKLVRRLGIGGMAETFEAVRSGPSGFEQRVCIKLVLPFFHQDANFIELFHREAKLAAKLRHSNIVGVIDFGQVDGRSYMALELVDGCDLRALLDAQDRMRLSAEHVALIGLDLAAALEHAHNPAMLAADESGSHVGGIVHRDISPSNVLISRYGEIKLTDFGVAKAISGTVRKQSTVKGKIPYMSPEQLKGDPVDGRSDLFALGVVMFEALSGRRPYEGASDPASILLTLNGEHPALRTLVPAAPAKLCEIIENLIQTDLERRPQTAVELIEALDEFTSSRRTRRELGETVAQTPRPIESLVPDVSSGVGESQADAPSLETPREATGVGQTKGPVPEAEAPTVPAAKAGLAASKGAAALPSETRSRRRGWMMAGGLVLAIGAVVTFGVLRPAPEEEAPAASNGVSVESEGAATTEPADAPEPVEATPPSESSIADAEPKAPPATPAPARLTVFVFPWGSVWINGKLEGEAPVRNRSLKPGRYQISAGKGSPSKTRTIRLRAGQRRTVEFDLTK